MHQREGLFLLLAWCRAACGKDLPPRLDRHARQTDSEIPRADDENVRVLRIQNQLLQRQRLPGQHDLARDSRLFLKFRGHQSAHRDGTKQ